MKTMLAFTRTLVALAVLLSFAAPGAADETPLSSEAIENSARTTISSNGSNFIASVVEPKRRSSCRTRTSRTICTQKLRVRDLLCGQRDGSPWPKHTRSFQAYAGNKTEDKMIEKRLVIMVPSPDKQAGYVALFNVPPSDENMAAVRHACLPAPAK